MDVGAVGGSASDSIEEGKQVMGMDILANAEQDTIRYSYKMEHD
jgi:hypothetical protein